MEARKAGIFISNLVEDFNSSSYIFFNNKLHEVHVMKISLVLLLGICVSFFSRQQANAQSLKIGFVNSSKILAEYRDAQDANKRLDAMAKQWQAELERMSTELKQKYEDYKKKEALMPEAEKRSQQEDLALLEQRGIQYRQQKFAADGELATATDSILGPIKKKVLKVIEQVAKDEKLQFIFDRNEQVSLLLYGDEKFDYTNFIIDRLKRGVSKSGK